MNALYVGEIYHQNHQMSDHFIPSELNTIKFEKEMLIRVN